MGREIKRVPADFDHPLREAWPGFVRDCGYEDCEGCAECEPFEPPDGDGWQLWETVSEGSPISPVFTDRDAFAAWLVENERAHPKAAEAFIDYGWAPSMVARPGIGLFSGIQAAAGTDVALEASYGPARFEAGARVRHPELGITGTLGDRLMIRRGSGEGFHPEPYASESARMVTWDEDNARLIANGAEPGTEQARKGYVIEAACIPLDGAP